MYKIISKLIISTIFIGFFACNSATEKRSETSLENEIEIAIDSNFVLENILELKNFTAISSKFGIENIKKDSTLNNKKQISVLFPNTPNQVIIYWNEKQKYNQILSAVVSCDSTGYTGKWHSKLGVQPGQSLSKIVALNNKEFTISGFGWDFGGHVVSWEGGQLDHKNLTGSFADFGKNKLTVEEYQSISGDTEYNVSLPAIKKMNPILKELTIY